MTVLEAIQKSADFLSKKGVEPPRLQAELLLAHILKLPRMKLYLNFERPLSSTETDLLREFVKRRGQREPLQHIVGSTSFCGYEIAVNRHVLVPRPETELLAEAGWQFLATLNPSSAEASAKGDQPSTALDFGTGSGCIAIALVAKCPTAQVWALDVSPEALSMARENALRNGVDGKITFIQTDGFQPEASANSALPAMRFDLIISNPPYIPAEEIGTLQAEVRDHDPRTALDGGVDGLDFYRMLAAQAGALLKPGGKIMLEFGDGQESAVSGIFSGQKWVVEAVKADYSQRPRFLIARHE